MKVKSKEIDEKYNLRVVIEAECSDCTELKKNEDILFVENITFPIGEFLSNHFWLITDDIILGSVAASRYTDDFKNLPMSDFKDKEDCRSKHSREDLFCQQVIVNNHNNEYNVHVRGKTIEALPHHLSITNAVRDFYREEFNLPSLWISSSNSILYAFWKQPETYLIKKEDKVHSRDFPIPTYDWEKNKWSVEKYTDEVKENLHDESFDSLVSRTKAMTDKLNKENK